MNRIEDMFQKKNKRVLSVYFTAGYPFLNNIERTILALESNGADMVEIGIPYSDPLADGEVIQETGKVAIANGMTLKTLFIQLEHIRAKTSIPLVLMGYLNPIIQFGFSSFCTKASSAGVDGLIIPDLPLYEYRRHYKAIIEKNRLSNIFLITPLTSDQRILEIDKMSTGFIYMVSSAATTGGTRSFTESQLDYFKRVAEMRLINPTMVGFGIHNHKTLEQVYSNGHGAIIGSAYLRAVSGRKEVESATSDFFRSLNKMD